MEEFVIFSICVHGKRADVQAKKVSLLLAHLRDDSRLYWATPFTLLRWAHGRKKLRQYLESVRLGQYTRLMGIFDRLLYTVLHWDEPEQYMAALEKIPGIGPKTVRFIALHSHPNMRIAALDTHILRYLREQGYDAPKLTPTSPRRYAELEENFLAECDMHGVEPAVFDLAIWNMYSSGKEADGLPQQMDSHSTP